MYFTIDPDRKKTIDPDAVINAKRKARDEYYAKRKQQGMESDKDTVGEYIKNEP